MTRSQPGAGGIYESTLPLLLVPSLFQSQLFAVPTDPVNRTRIESNRITAQHALPCHSLPCPGRSGFVSLPLLAWLRTFARALRCGAVQRDATISSLALSCSGLAWSRPFFFLCRRFDSPLPKGPQTTPLGEKGRKKGNFHIRVIPLNFLFLLRTNTYLPYFVLPCLCCIVLTRSSQVPGDAGTIGKRDKWSECLIPFSFSLDAFISQLSLL